MKLDQAQAVYADALQQMKDGTFQSAIAAQAAAIDLQSAESIAQGKSGDGRG